MMGEVSPVLLGTEAMAQLLALTVSNQIENATNIAVLNLELGKNVPSSGGNPAGIGQILDITA